MEERNPMTDAEVAAWRESTNIRGKWTVPITRETFPLNAPVVLESFIDTNCGWEFDAPLHFMRPFHWYREVGSCCPETVEAEIEDILIDLDCGRELVADASAWPYTGSYLKRLFRNLQNGKQRCGIAYYRSTVVVTAWSNEEQGGDIEYVRYTVKTVEKF